MMFMLTPMGPVDIHQGKEHRVVKIVRATCINASKGKRNGTEHVLSLQQEVGKGENGERSRAQIRKRLVRHVKCRLDLEGNRELSRESFFQHESDMI